MRILSVTKIFTGIMFAGILMLSPGLHAQSEDHLKLIFAGDIMGHDSQINAAKNHKNNTYIYDTCFSLLKPYLKSADIAIANLEVTLAGPPYKGYPRFSSPDELADAAKNAGFNVLITANNHSMDRGKEGLERTIDVLTEKGIIATGTFKNQVQRKRKYPLIIEKNNIRIGLLNYTYGTNGLPAEEPNIVNYIDTTHIRNDLQKTVSVNPDLIIVTIHWGREYERDAGQAQRKLAGFIMDHGADMIIGSHPHVVQNIEANKIHLDNSYDKLVVYSLGNFVSNQRKRYTDGGILFEVNIKKSEKTNKTIIADYSYMPVWVHKPKKSNIAENHFVLIPGNQSDYFQDLMIMPSGDRDKMNLFIQDTKEHLKDIPLSPYLFQTGTEMPD